MDTIFQFNQIRKYVILTLLCVLMYHPVTFAKDNRVHKLYTQMDSLIQKKSYKEAIALGKKQLSKQKKNSIDYAQILYRLAKANIGVLNFSETEKLLEKSMTIAEKHGDASIDLQCDIAYKTIDYILIVEPSNFDKLSALYEIALKKADKANTLITKEIDCILNDSTNMDIQKADSISAKMEYRIWQSEYYFAKCFAKSFHYVSLDEILEICNKLKEQSTKLFEEDSEELAQTYLLCGELQEGKSKFEEAMNYYNISLNLYSQLYGIESLECANVNYLIGKIEAKLGDTQAALEKLQRTLAAYEQQQLYNDTYIATLETIAAIFTTEGEYENALNYFKKAEDYGIKLFGAASLNIFRYRVNMIEIMIAMEAYDKALAVINDMEAYINENFDYLNDEVLFKISYLEALVYMNTNRFAHARIVLQALTERIENSDISNQESSIKFYNKLGYCSYRTGQYDDAYTYYKNYMDLAKRYAHEIFTFMPEANREHYWMLQSQYLESLLNINHTAITYDPEQEVPIIPSSSFDGRSSLLYDAALLQKGTLMEASKNMFSAIETNDNKELQKKMKRLQDIQQFLSNQALHRKDGSDNNIEQLQSESRLLEQELITQARQYTEYMNFLTISWQDVHKVLGDNDVAIEFICSTENGRKYYSAEVLRKDFTAPKHIQLFSIEENKPLTFTMKRPDRFLWPKIMPYLNEQDNVYFAASGDLHKYSIEYFLINSQERMHDRYYMHRVSSTRQLVLNKPIQHKGYVSLYGGMDYNLGIEEMTYYAEISKYRGEKEHQNLNWEESIPQLWGYLPGTENEVINIAPILEQEGYQTTTYLGAESIEENFKIQSGNSSNIIHIATHGFYHPRESQKGIVLSNFQTTAEDESLLCSGLIFSGANHAWLGKGLQNEDIDDGILTAKEIASMNLQSTDLVVLSACQTGQGEITGEGVFGLQRAFKKAGVGTILMTLWEVNDEATQMLMTSFYNQYAKGMSKHEALKIAQNEIKNRMFVNDKGIEVSGEDPHFWASFILLD